VFWLTLLNIGQKRIILTVNSYKNLTNVILWSQNHAFSTQEFDKCHFLE
jgi:hypothetical protein